ncbi:MAG TPA: ATP-binding protein [Granulicella sp.]
MVAEAEKPDVNDPLELVAEALQRSEERAVAGQLALEVMHEIKNPLEALGYLVYLARECAEDPLDPQKVRQYLDTAKEQMKLLSGIVGQTLGMTRPSDRPRRTDLSLLAESALRIHLRGLESKKIRVIRELEPGTTILCHPGQILQVLSNLIANTLDALPKEGTLRLRVHRRANCAILLLADDGHGIEAGYMGRIFEPFFTTKQEHGSGLGLALSKRIVEQHHGRIAVRSSTQAGRSGTVFRLELPAIA